MACCRSPETAADLIALSSVSSNRLQIQTLDVEDEQSIADFGTYMRQSYARVDLLLNIAGVLGDAKTTPGPEKSVAGVDRDWLQKTLQVNVMGPVMLTKELHPLLIQSRRTGRSSTTGSRLPDESSPLERPKAVVVNLSARVGSISDNNLGGWYSYRMSKAALNMFTRTLALELKRQSVWAVALHPGTTNTDLSKPFQANVRDGSLFPVDFTVAQLFNVIDSLKEENSGGFYDWSGQSLSF